MEFSDPEEVLHNGPQPTTPSLRRSTREWCPSQRLIVLNFIEELYFTQGTYPQTVNEALSGPNAHEWQNAMDVEYQALLKKDMDPYSITSRP